MNQAIDPQERIASKGKPSNNIYHLLRDLTAVNGHKLTNRQMAILYKFESIGPRKVPSHAQLAWWQNCSISSIKTDLNQLKKLDLLRWNSQLGSSNVYQLNEPLIESESRKCKEAWGVHKAELDKQGERQDWRLPRRNGVPTSALD